MKAKKYRREILLKAHRYAKYQQDFLGVVLCKSEDNIAGGDKAGKAIFKEQERG